MYDLIIIGGGPAGITAGIYGARQKLKILLITEDFGGQIAEKSVAIENFPGFKEISGSELIQKFEEHLNKFEVEIKKSSVVKIKKIGKVFTIFTKNKKQFKSKAVIVASGANPRPLEVSGEKEYIGRGVSYCPVCDGAFFKDKIVLVVGGGEAGFETALALSEWAKKIYIFEFGKEAKASPFIQEKVRGTKKIIVMTRVVLKEIKGEKFVNSVVYQNLKSKKIKTLKLDGVFIQIGQQPATSFVKGLVEFDKYNQIKVNSFTGESSTPGLFAAGDSDNVPYKQIVIACGEGAKAALSAYKYLQIWK